MAEGKHQYKGVAEALAAFGRNGDSVLMHVNPVEVQALNNMAPGSITINPDTGQPEAFFWLIPALLEGVLGAIGTGATAVASGLAGAGGGTAIGGAASLIPEAIAGVAGFGEAAMGGLAGVLGAPEAAAATAPEVFGEIPAMLTGTGAPAEITTAGMQGVGSGLAPGGGVLQIGAGGGAPGIGAITPAATPAPSFGSVASQQLSGMQGVNQALNTPSPGAAPSDVARAMSHVGGGPGLPGSDLGRAVAGQISGPSDTLRAGIDSVKDAIKPGARPGGVPFDARMGGLNPEQLANVEKLGQGLRGFGSGVGPGSSAGVTKPLVSPAVDWSKVPVAGMEGAPPGVSASAGHVAPRLSPVDFSKVPTQTAGRTTAGSLGGDAWQGAKNYGNRLMGGTPGTPPVNKAQIDPKTGGRLPQGLGDALGNLVNPPSTPGTKNLGGRTGNVLGALGRNVGANPMPYGLGAMYLASRPEQGEAPDWAKGMERNSARAEELWSPDFVPEIMHNPVWGQMGPNNSTIAGVGPGGDQMYEFGQPAYGPSDPFYNYGNRPMHNPYGYIYEEEQPLWGGGRRFA